MAGEATPQVEASRNAIVTGQHFYRLEEGANINGTLKITEPNFMYILCDNGYEIGHWRKAWGPGDASVGGYTESPCGPYIEFGKFLSKRADPDQGIREFIVGTGGKNHTTGDGPIDNSEVINADSFGVLKLTLNPAGYDWLFVPVLGASFTDAGSGVCH